MTFLSALSSGMAVLLLTQSAHAQQVPAAPQPGPSSEEDELTLVYGDKTQVSIATGSELPLRRAPAVASVITAADIAAMGATDLDQVLESVAGVHVNRSFNQYAPTYVVRGITSAFAPQVLVLQNGIPITTLYQGNKGSVWAGYPVEHIARIEVLRGPGSALYGSDAYSGVINIITKDAADIAGTELGLRAGSFATRDGYLLHGGTLGPAAVALYARVGRTAGFRSVIDADAQTRNDTLAGTHASLAGGPVNVGNQAADLNLDVGLGQWRLRLGYKLRDDVGTGAGIASALDPVGRSRSERLTTDLAWTAPQLGQDWSGGVVLSTLYYTQLTPVDYQLLPPGTLLPSGLFPNGMNGGPDFSEQQVRLSATVAYTGFQHHRLRAGIGHDDLNLYRTHETRNFTYSPAGLPMPLPATVDFSASNPYLLPQRRKVDYLYLQDEVQLAADWTLTAGVRHDHYSDFGGTTNPRLALVWDAALDLTAKLLAGRAFRAPSFNESYSITNPVALGNPKLKPETNRTVEAALAWQARADLNIDTTLYHYAMGNIIRAVPNAIANTGATYANAGDQHGHGVEVEARWAATRALRLAANYSWQRSVDAATGQDAGYAPRQHLWAHAGWQLGEGLQLGVQANWVAGRQRAPGDLRAPVADYRTLDLNLRGMPARGRWSYAAGVHNLFNADVREPSQAPGLQIPHDLPMAPRAFTVQATYHM